METNYQPFEELRIWKEGMEICYVVYNALEGCKDYGLRNQMERAAVSIPSNIAEGYELNSDRGFIRYLLISKGSSGELRTQLYIAIRRNYISKDEGNRLLTRIKVETAMIQKFIIARRKRMVTGILKKTISTILFWV